MNGRGCCASRVAVGAIAADSDEACAPTSGVPVRVNCSCGTRKQVRGPRLSVRESVAVCRFGIGYSQPQERCCGAKSAIHKILHNRVYTGDFDFDGVTYKGTYEPIVSHE